MRSDDELSEFKLCKFDEAYELLEKMNNKKCLTKAKEKLEYLNVFQEI